MTTLDQVRAGYEAWAAKPHNAKWVKRLDGTPIANDIIVCIFDVLSSIPEQEAGVKPVDETLVDVCLAMANDITEKLRGKEVRHGPVAHEIAQFIYNCATKGGLAFHIAPSQPAAVAVTDEMVEAAWAEVTAFDFDRAGMHRAIEAALRSTP